MAADNAMIEIDPPRERYPMCIVWTTIPIVSWILPFIGHIGICDSEGNVYDFQGSYTIGTNNMIFGKPLKYVDLRRRYVPAMYKLQTKNMGDKDAEMRAQAVSYDNALAQVVRHFRHYETYNFFVNNCHSFAAAVLNAQEGNTKHHTMVTVCFDTLLHGKAISKRALVKIYAPSLIFWLVVTLVCLLLGLLL